VTRIDGVTSYPCPSCRTPANLTSGCPGCGRRPDPDAAEVVRLDTEIALLTARLAAAREAVTGADAALRRAWVAREAAASRVRASLLPPAVPGPAAAPHPALPAAASGPASAAAAPHPASAAAAAAAFSPRAREASTRLVQNALFLLGGLLLAVAATVFTAVAWAQFGVGGRALLLAGFTVAALSAPLAALRRGLTATAETFSAVGLVLVLLDGYAAWYVNLFGVADHSAVGYAGAVCAVTAAVAAGYEHVTGLAAPRFAALLVAQPVVPLLMAPLHPNATGWSYTLTAVAVLNLVVLRLRRSAGGALVVTAYLLGGGAAALAALTALTDLVMLFAPGAVALAAGALVAAALVPLAAAVLAGATRAQSITGGLLVIALAVAGSRLAGVAGGSFAAPVLIAAVVTAVAVLVAVVQRLLPAPVRRGPWTGALLVVAFTGVVVAGVTIAAAATGYADWRLPAVIVLLTAALAVLVPRALQPHVALGGLAMLAIAAPASFPLPWWTAPAFDLTVVAVALALALRGAALWPVSVAIGLTSHAVVVALDQPWVACATFAGVAAVGLATALAARPGSWTAGGSSRSTGVTAAGGVTRLIGGAALAVGMLAVPPAAWNGAAALSLSAAVQSRSALAAAALLVAVLPFAGQGYRPYALVATLLAVVTAPAWALASGDSPAIYAAIALLLIALTFARTVSAGLAALPLGAALVVATASSVAGVLVRPYAWLGQVWTGRPAGTGVGPVALADVVALGILAVAVVVAVQATSGRRPAAWAVAPVLAVITPMGFAATGVPWPGVPAESLIIGLAGLLTVALRRPPAAAGPASTGAALTAPASIRAGLTGAASTGAVLTGPASIRAGMAGVASTGAASTGAVLTGPASIRAGMAGVASTGAVLTGPASIRAALTGAASICVVLTGAALTGAGLAGSLPTHGATLAALGLTLIAGTAAGAAGRGLGARLAGWLTGAAATVAFAYTVGRAAELSMATSAFVVLGAAAVILAAGALLRPRAPVGGWSVGGRSGEGRAVGDSSVEDRSVGGRSEGRWPVGGRALEGRAVEAAAHAGAVVALLLAASSVRHAAAVCAFWGLALGVRSLRPGEAATVRRGYVVAAAVVELGGWWLLIAAERVATAEAYTLPAAGVALLAGWLARRSRAGLTSWVAYGPALAAALLPTLASVLVAEQQPLRRLLLGLGALAVLLAGAYARLRAPVVAGGAVLAVVALHELVLAWDLLPRWIPLAAAGLLLVGLAMTLERRRRDLARFRATLARLG
jgi:hypothetical protein